MAPGFSLLETIVAAAIVAVAFSVAFSGISTSARGTERIDAADRRVEAARSILAAIDLIDRVGPGDRAEGVTPDGFGWRIETRAFIPAGPGQPLAVIEITLEIDSPEPGGPTWSIPSYKTVTSPDTAPSLVEQLEERLEEQVG
jgi:prepilin-type N-terminal cleavage/methylation domain-containing protein